MNDDERRLHDWFDEELDRMSISGDRPVDPRRVFASETDRALSETAADLRRLDAAQSGEPSEEFLNNLEQQLMGNASATSHARPSRAAIEELGQSGVRLEMPAPARRATAGWAYRFASFAILLALIGATAFGVTRLRDSGGRTPPTYTAMGSGSLETPTTEPPTEPTAGEWRVSTDASARIANDEIGRTEGLAVIENVLIRAWSDSDASGLEAFSTTDGELLWTNDSPWQIASSNFPGAVGNYAFQHDAQQIYVLVNEPPTTDPIGEAPRQALFAIDVSTGDNVWAKEFAGGVASIGTGPLGLYVHTYGDGLHKLDPATGETIWIYTGDPADGMSIAPYSGNDALIVVSSNGAVESIDPDKGGLIWRVEVGLPSHSFSIAEGAIDSGQKVVIIRAADPPIGETADLKNTLLAVELESGDVLWTRTLNNPGKGQLEAANGMIYATTSLGLYDITNDAGEKIDTGFRNWLVAIDLETGDEIWSIESDPAWGMAFELTDDTLIMYRSYGAFVAVDLDTGSIICDAFTPSGASSDDDDRSPDAGAYDGGMLYLSLKNGEVMAVDPGNWTC